MAKVVEYGTYIIDLADAMIDHRRGLDNEHLSCLQTVRDRTVRFVTSCIQHENADLETLHHFLTGGAKQSVAIIISYSDFLMMDEALHIAYRDAVGRIKECALSIKDELQQMEADLIAFMEKIGLSVRSRRESRRKKPIQSLQAQSGLQVDYLDDDIVPAPPSRKPIQRLPKPAPRPTQPKAPQAVRQLSARRKSASEKTPTRRVQHVQRSTKAQRHGIRRLQPQA